MNTKRQEQWQQILDMTQKMREMAVPNESLADLSVDEEYARQPWHAIAELEQKRTAALKEFFKTEPATDETEMLRAGLEQIKQTDAELTKVSLSIQQQIARTFSKMGNSQRAVEAYSSNR